MIDDTHETRLAVELFRLGARLQVTRAETALPRERLIRLYKESHGESPPKGRLPASTDWYVTWLPNIHASLYYALYEFAAQQSGVSRITATMTAYRLYLEHLSNQAAPVLSFTRAWMLVNFVEQGVLHRVTCAQCHGRFVARAHAFDRNYVCGLCRPPARAGKTGRAATSAGHRA